MCRDKTKQKIQFGIECHWQHQFDSKYQLELNVANWIYDNRAYFDMQNKYSLIMGYELVNSSVFAMCHDWMLFKS